MIFPAECAESVPRPCHIICYKMVQYAQRENDSGTISLEITIILWKHPASC